MLDEAGEIVFEGSEATAFMEALETGTASAEYLREADETFARLYSPEPLNRLVDGRGAAAVDEVSEPA